MSKKSIDTKILLISNNKPDVDEVQQQLKDTLRIHCCIWHYRTLQAGLDCIAIKKLNPDLIILDLGLVGVEIPEEVYNKMMGSIQHVPIIVIAEEKDYKLVTLVLKAGASDRILRGDFSRLEDAIELSLIRNQIFHKEHRKVEILRKKHIKDVLLLASEIKQHKVDMQASRNAKDKTKAEHDQMISWMTGGYSMNIEYECS